MKTREEKIPDKIETKNIENHSLVFGWDFSPRDTPFVVVAEKKNDQIYVLTQKNTYDGAVVYRDYRKEGDTVREFVGKVLKIGSKRPLCLFNEYGEGYIDCIENIKKIAKEYGVEVEE